MNIEEEIDLVYRLITHPAGYGVDMHGSLWIRQYEYPEWAVEWEMPDRKIEVREFVDPLEAAKFFVNKRHEFQAGLDYERENNEGHEHISDSPR